MEITKKYTAKIQSKPSAEEGCWNGLVVQIFETQEDGGETLVGSYERNYHCLYNTFLPFAQNGQEYALYSPDYTATRVMRLPSCEDLCGEEPESIGFCPVDFHIPVSLHGGYGLVAGCHWGDDSSWKIQHLDLTRIEEGILVRSQDRFGYAELPYQQSLAEAATGCDESDWLTLNLMFRFQMQEKDSTEAILGWLQTMDGLVIKKVMERLRLEHCHDCGHLLSKTGRENWACKCQRRSNRSVAIIGLAGDPPTTAHLTLARLTWETGWFDEVWLMPCHLHNFGKQMTSEFHRLKMCEIVVNQLRQEYGRSEQEKFHVSDFEIQQQLTGKTYETWKLLRQTHPDTQFSFVIGMDNANRLDEWAYAEELKKEVPFVIFPRKGIEQTAEWFNWFPHRFVNILQSTVSSTEFRNLFAEGQLEQAAILVDPQIYTYWQELHRETTIGNGTSQGLSAPITEG